MGRTRLLVGLELLLLVVVDEGMVLGVVRNGAQRSESLEPVGVTAGLNTGWLRMWVPRLRVDCFFPAELDKDSLFLRLPELLEELKSASLPLGRLQGRCSRLCLVGGVFHSAMVSTLTRLAWHLRSWRDGEHGGLWSEPDGVLAGEPDWLLGHPVSSEEKLFGLIVRFEHWVLKWHSLESSSENG